MDFVVKLVEYARSIEKEKNKNFRFTLTTNGVLIDDDVIEFANKEMSNVVLSLDGRKEIHDLTRVDYAGNGSYDTIVPKFKQMVESRGGKDYYMRGTFTHANPDFTKDKIFNNIEFRADSWDKEEILTNNTFDTLDVWNEYQQGCLRDQVSLMPCMHKFGFMPSFQFIEENIRQNKYVDVMKHL